MREREVFQQEQEERERQWHMEKEQLQEAQKRLDAVSSYFKFFLSFFILSQFFIRRKGNKWKKNMQLSVVR